jgi:hypothetical protein
VTVYSNRFVLCVLVNGKPQQELANGVVPIEFGSEYSLRFRNKNDRRAVVRFTIDGENVSGNGYIIPAHSAIDIHRHWDKDAKFKFVELDSPKAVDHGKNGPNLDGSKGVIEAKFYLEKPWTPHVQWSPPVHHYHHHHHHYRKQKLWDTTWGGKSNPDVCPELKNPYVPMSESSATSGESMLQNLCCTQPQNTCSDFSKSAVMPPAPPTFTLQEGCTVEGGRSGQNFSTSYIDLETDYVAVRCVLKGTAKKTIVRSYL